MIWQGLFRFFFSLTLLPAGAATAAGRAPRRLRDRMSPSRPRGWGFLALYAATVLNAVARLTDAAPGTVLVCTVVGGTVAVAGWVLVAVATDQAHGARG